MANLPCTLAMLLNCHPSPRISDRNVLAGRIGQDNPGAQALMKEMGELDVPKREALLMGWFTAGFVPKDRIAFKAIVAEGNGHQLIYWVMRDYLALGSDEDSVRIPLSWTTAKVLASSWHLLLPTARMVDQIYGQAQRVYWPHAYPPSDAMRSTSYLIAHDRWITDRPGFDLEVAPLTAGQKKDLVVSPRLLEKSDKLAIYGWHNLGNGAPIQPLSLWHGAFYVDYSHGLRFVAREGMLDGKVVLLSDVLKDPLLAPLISSEGAFDICAILGYACDEASP